MPRPKGQTSMRISNRQRAVMNIVVKRRNALEDDATWTSLLEEALDLLQLKEVVTHEEIKAELKVARRNHLDDVLVYKEE